MTQHPGMHIVTAHLPQSDRLLLAAPVFVAMLPAFLALRFICPWFSSVSWHLQGLIRVSDGSLRDGAARVGGAGAVSPADDGCRPI